MDKSLLKKVSYVMSKIQEAIKNEDLETITHLVKSETQPDRGSYLHVAFSIDAPSVKVLKHLIGLGVDIDSKDEKGLTPLHLAARAKSVELLEVLLGAGAKVDLPDNDNITPLHQSLLDMPVALSIVELLLRHGANPDRRYQGQTVKRVISQMTFPNKEDVLSVLETYKMTDTTSRRMLRKEVRG